ncbi:UNVERIFIED_CONTAM: hypothetical protein Sangu_2706800 [Sesamum angustifolium]|uniref:Uncharacterized protein n=1 Tax=Sesamum angustifolium TaxID=2727405 RepID=A0AAW2IY94_9LAMI
MVAPATTDSTASKSAGIDEGWDTASDDGVADAGFAGSARGGLGGPQLWSRPRPLPRHPRPGEAEHQ